MPSAEHLGEILREIGLVDIVGVPVHSPSVTGVRLCVSDVPVWAGELSDGHLLAACRDHHDITGDRFPQETLPVPNEDADRLG